MKDVPIFRFILPLLLMLAHLSSLQASVEIRSTRLTTVNGLADNSVRQIFQDNIGFLWMATLNGLSRYDGNAFVNFYPQENDPITLADHRIRNVLEDRNGFLWINTYSDIFGCYDLKKDCFVDFTGRQEHTAHYSQISILDDDTWLWGKSEGCVLITYRNGKFASESFNTRNKRLPTDNVRQIKRGSDGQTYIVTDNGLFSWKKGELKCVQPQLSVERVLFYKNFDVFITTHGEIWMNHAGKFGKVGDLPLPKNGITITGVLNIQDKCLILTSAGCYTFHMDTRRIEKASPIQNIPNGAVKTDNRGNYWVSNNTGNLYYIHAETGVTRVLPLVSKDNLGLLNRESYHVIHDSRNIIWIASYGSGLFAYNPLTQELQQFTVNNSQTSHIGSNFLQNIMEDRSGSIWVSSEFSGVSHLSVINEGATRIYPENSEDTNLNTVRMVTEGNYGNIWLGTRDGGTYRYNSDLSVQQEKTSNGISTYALLEEKTGTKWIGTRRTGLYIDGRQYRRDASDSTSLSYDAIYSILKDRNGRVWVGTFGGGLDLAIPGKSKYTFRQYLNGVYGQRWIRCLMEDRNGWIWAGTSGGFCVFHPDSLIENPNNYHVYDKAGKYLKSDEIRSIMQDSKGRVWIAESGAGFCVCTPDKGYGKLTFTHYDISDGLVSSKVQAFAEDARGIIWISTEYGMSSFNPDTRTFENYFFSDLMQGNIYTENSAIRLADGRLAFGSNYGLVIISPEKVGESLNTSSITFTNLKLDGISVRSGDPDSPLQSTLAYVNSIQLKHFQNAFALEFSTLDYSASNLSKYSYKLENYEDKWSIPSTLNFAAYKNLSPGTYYLHVKACNAAGVWSEQEAVLKIVVAPPFWKTIWAFFIYIVLTLIVFYLVLKIVHKMNSLRAKINIEKQLTEYKLVFFTNISHEFRTPLTLIQGALEKIQHIQNMPREAGKSLQVMDKNSRRMLRLINQLLEFRKMQNDKLALSLEEADVVSFLYEIFLSFGDVAEQKNMNFRFQSPVKSYKMFIDKGKMDKIAYNLLSNAFKYTPAGQTILFSIQIDETKKMLQFQVSDEGVGIPKDKQHELFKRFMQSNFSGDSIGVGLHLTHELVTVHKGTITHTDQEGGGAVFLVSIPIDKSVYEAKDFLLSSENVLLKETDKQTDAFQTLPEDSAEEKIVPLNKRKVLIIEDDADIRAMLKEEIGLYMEIEVAEDGKTGVEKAQAGDIDLIVCDVLMPGMTGFDVTRKLKYNFETCHIPIVLLTALSAPENQLEGIDAGADAYITKPFSIKYLTSRVLRLIEQREKLRDKFSKEPGMAHTAICSTNRDKEFTDRMTQLIEAHITRPEFSVEEFAQLMNLSRTVLYNKVRGITGYSPVEYLRIVRLKKAAELLLSGEDLTMSEIAYEVGFSDPFYFSRCFKAQFGISPSIYQKERRTEEG